MRRTAHGLHDQAHLGRQHGQAVSEAIAPGTAARDVACQFFPIDVPQSADEGTLIGVLTADSSDGNPANAVHLEEICANFRARELLSEICQESVGRSTYADCDRSGALDLLHLIVEIKGYRREDAKEKKSTMETYWVPGVNHLGTFGRWAFAEFTDVYQIQADFEEKVEQQFNEMIEATVQSLPAVPTE